MGCLTICKRGGATCVVLMLAGELDVQSAAALRIALVEAVEARARAVTVDVSHLRLCDSVGISALIFGYQRAGLHGITFAVINPRGEVATVLAATGLKDLLGPHEATSPPGYD